MLESSSMKNKILELSSLPPSAKELLAKYSEGAFPVSVVSIASELGAEVFSDSVYPDNGNGHIELDDKGEASIIVNDAQSPERKRFTIAHEIAHLLMDKDYLKQHKIMDRDGNAADDTYRARETRANQFAAELLMPEKEFVKQWLSHKGDLDKICEFFGVSKSAAQWRAINTGVLKVW